MTSPRPAVLFDIDGTLLDTNYLHTVAWWYALQEAGEDIPMARIHPLIGMGSDQLLTELLGHERDGLSDLHAKYYEPYKTDLRSLPGAAGILAAVAAAGVQVVLATSSKEEDLEALLGVLGAEEGVIAEIVHGDMVDSSKPAPDIFAVAMDRLDLDPGQAMVVGDTRWDVEAAAKLGVDVVAVLTGGTTRADLLDAGAVAVYDDVADLLEHLDDSPLARLLGADATNR